jgi:hypothetical protein
MFDESLEQRTSQVDLLNEFLEAVESHGGDEAFAEEEIISVSPIDKPDNSDVATIKMTEDDVERSAPTTATPTAQPTTAAPTTAAPTTAAPTSLTTILFSNWQFVSGNNNYFGDDNSGAIYGWATGTSGTTIITGTLVITGGSENIQVCAAPAGTSALVSVTCDLIPTSGTSYSFSASKSIAGGPSCDDQVVAPGTYAVTLRGVFGTNSAGQSVYIN